MIQQVNLYHHLFEQKQEKPAFNRYLIGLALFFLLLAGFSIYLLVDAKQTKTNLELAQLTLQDAEMRIEDLRTQYPEQPVDSQITHEIIRLENILTNLSSVLHLLTDKESDQTQGFSHYFSALARQSIAEVWLSNIYVDAEKHNLILKGSTFHPQKTPAFLQNLQQEPIFHGKSFAKLIMSRSEKNASQIDFTISTAIKKTEAAEQIDHD